MQETESFDDKLQYTDEHLDQYFEIKHTKSTLMQKKVTLIFIGIEHRARPYVSG